MSLLTSVGIMSILKVTWISPFVGSGHYCHSHWHSAMNVCNRKYAWHLNQRVFLKHSTARPICHENNSQWYIFDVCLLKSDKCCKVGKVTQLHTHQELLYSSYLTTGWDDELIKLRVLTAPLKKSILDVLVEQLSVEKQTPPVKFKTKQMLKKVRRSTEPIWGVVSKHQWQGYCYGVEGSPA